MRQFLSLVVLLCFAVPAGVSVSGCGKNVNAAYCQNSGVGQKAGVLNNIDLEPRTTGISLGAGQTTQVTTPQGYDCNGSSVTVSNPAYGSSNFSLVDISPTGLLCAGTWNRQSPGGIPNYTICTPPVGLSNAAQPFAQATITVSSQGVTSNKVIVYVHPLVSTLTLVGPSSCISQGKTAPNALDVSATYLLNNVQTPLCGPAGSGAPAACSSVIGPLTFTPADTTIATIDQNGVITAQAPGSTAITATNTLVSGVAGYFSTCPPKSIAIAFPNDQSSAVVSQGTPQNLTTTVYDTNGNIISGLTLDYQSTNVARISASSGGQVTANFPGTAEIYAVCQPPSCNNSPTNRIGINGNGIPVVSNPVVATSPGALSSLVWIASSQSRYFNSLDLTTGTVGTPTRLPYQPNSVRSDQNLTNLYFGSSVELMTVPTGTNTVSAEDTRVPGVVLAVSPDNSQVLINDQARQLFYLYATASKTFQTFHGVGTRAQWTPDSKTLYIAGPNALYVYNVFSGFSSYDLSATGGAADVALTIPSVGAYLTGNATVAHAFCPDLAANLPYPQADRVDLATERAGATEDGRHVLGAIAGGGTLTVTDIGLLNFGLVTPLDLGNPTSPDSNANGSSGACFNPATGAPVTLTFSSSHTQSTLPLAASDLNQVVTSTTAELAFITYANPAGGPGAVLPYYQAAAPGSAGTLGAVVLSGTASAPLGGAFTADQSQFVVGTAGDNLVHFVDAATFTDVKQINPQLTSDAGAAVPAEFILTKPRAAR